MTNLNELTTDILTTIRGKGWLPLACLAAFSPEVANEAAGEYRPSDFGVLAREAAQAAFRHSLMPLTDHDAQVNGYGIQVPDTDFSLWVFQGYGQEWYEVRHPQLGQVRLA